jgi:hypothetical protein
VNITVHLSKAFQGVCEHRAQLNLGFPATAQAGEMIEMVFALYPGLVAFQLGDTVQNKKHLVAALHKNHLYFFGVNA